MAKIKEQIEDDAIMKRFNALQEESDEMSEEEFLKAFQVSDDELDKGFVLPGIG